jgi:uncharacterized metal-binding protein YceD (DUF177 family)
MDKAAHPWSVPVTVEEIPETGLHLELEAPDAVRTAVARLANVREVSRLSAAFDLKRRGAGVQVDGQVSGRVGQTCVVTLEPIENDVTEPVGLRFAPEAPMAADDPETAGDLAAALTDEEPPEPLIGGKVDLGAIATEFLMLGIDPYPRKPGVQFTAPEVKDTGANPFAALEALKKGPGGGKS